MRKEKKPNSHTVLVVFGATGDLMERKLVPALYYLFEQKKLPAKFSVIGFSRRDWSDEDLQNHITKSLRKHYHLGQPKHLGKFLKLFAYHKGQLEEEQAYNNLDERLDKLERKLKLKLNKLFYLAVPPQYYGNLFSHLHSSGLMKPYDPTGPWNRIIVEKPFGKDLLHAQELDKQLAKLFSEEQVYRIDHYLAKEILQNIMAFRFSNNLLEDVWSSRFIEKVEIKLLEEIDVEGRGEFYDGVGALLDVGQNHLLQMLALVTMDNPGSLSGLAIQGKRAAVMENLHILNRQEIENLTVRAQYKNYRKEEGVEKNSNTETYFKVRAQVDSLRWQGVPFYIESGKNFPAADKQIVITFKHPSPCLCPPGQHLKNKIFFRIQPNPGITIEFWSKQPGSKMLLEKKSLDFSYGLEGHQRYLAEYARLFADAIEGEQTLFVSSREALAAWKFIDPIVKSWQSKLTPLHFYGKDHKILEQFSSEKLEQKAAAVYPEKIAMLGLGKMGKNLSLQLMEKGYGVVTAAGHSAQAIEELKTNPKFFVAENYQKMLESLPSPRVVWLMLPHEQVDEVLFGKNGLAKILKRGDIVVEGANSFYKNSLARGKKLQKKGVEFLGVGVSGGPKGARVGACLMIGGNKRIFKKLESLFRSISVEGGYQFFEGYGSGHFLKMVHNGIEYGMMQAIAEGFGIIEKFSPKVNLEKVADLYNHGSVIESRLVGWLKNSFVQRGQNLKGISGVVGYTGEGQWTAQTAKEFKLPAKIIEQSFRFRVQSKKTQSFISKVVSALREQFGGHSVK